MNYFGMFSCKEDVVNNFAIDAKALKGAKILLAWYGDGDYCGSAFVLFKRGSKLYEVHGSHCSCYGLEGQWEPEETSVEALAHILKDGYMISDSYDYAEEANAALKRVLKQLKK